MFTINNIVDRLSDNAKVILESTNTGDMATTPLFIDKLLKQTFANTILPQITSLIPLKASQGYIFSLQSYYKGNGSSLSANFENTKVLSFNTANSFVIDDIITYSGGSAKVLYVEPTQILIEVISGTNPVNNIVVSKGAYNITVATVLPSNLLIKKIFSQYSQPKNTNDSESMITEVNEIGHTVIKKLITTKTRKLKTSFTKEVLQDFQNMFGESFEDLVIDILSKEIIEEVENEIFNYMSSIAVPTNELVFSNNPIESGSPNFYMLSDITTRIFKEIANISSTSGRNLDCFVITSSQVISMLASTGNLAWGKSGDISSQKTTRNSNYIGIALGAIDIFQNDFTSNPNEIIVGYKSKTEVIGDAGIIYTPYLFHPYFAIDPENGKETLFIMYRYNYTTNLLDNFTSGGSDYFRKFNINIDGLQNY